MRIAITHTTRFDYTADVANAVSDVRLGPLSDSHQRTERYDLRVQPHGSVRRYTDGFGNLAHLVTVSRPHNFLEITASMEAFTYLIDPFQPSARPARALTPSERADYLSPSPMVPLIHDLTRIAEPFRPKHPEEAFETVRALMASIHDDYDYQQHVTTVTSTVAEVISGRAGVCQDFAHLLIGLCRSIGIAARYVSGYVLGPEPASAPEEHDARASGDTRRDQSADARATGPSRGAGASHAWVEAYTPTHGWRGFDPTNNLLANDHYIKIALGRDYRDAAPTRGTYRGPAEQTLAVHVAARALE